MAIRDSMRNSAATYLRQGEPVQAVFAGQTASQYLAALGGFLFFLNLNRYRIFVVTPDRILILDAGKFGMSKAKGLVTELPRATRLGPGSGLWHVIPVGREKLRVHRRFFQDIEAAAAQVNPAWVSTAS
jgi:hypothetical protein